MSCTRLHSNPVMGSQFHLPAVGQPFGAHVCIIGAAYQMGNMSCFTVAILGMATKKSKGPRSFSFFYHLPQYKNKDPLK